MASPPAPEASSSGIQLFSAPSDAPRVRRINDLVAAAFSAGLLALVGLLAWNGAAVDDSWIRLVGDLPGWVRWSGQVLYVFSVVYAALLVIGVAVLARHRLELVRDLLAAAVAAVAGVVLLARWFDGRWPAANLLDLDRPPVTFPALFVAAVVAVEAAAAPHLSAPVREWGRRIVLAGSAGAALGAVGRPTDVLGAVLVGLLAAAAIRYAFGTSTGLPSLARLRRGLADLNVTMVDLRYLDDQPVGSAVLAGTDSSGDNLLIRMLGRDTWDARWFARAWRFAWYEDDGPQYGSSRREQIEHEALVLMLAKRAGVLVPDVVSVGMSGDDDGLLAVRASATPLSEVDASGIDDGFLDGCWEQVKLLHDAGIAHGRFTPTNMGIDAEGRPVVAGFSSASIGAFGQERREDVVELLVTLGLATTHERALASARRVLGDQGVIEALPAMEPAALSPPLRHAVRRARVKIGDLRKATAAELGVDPPKVEALARVSLTKVLMLAFGAFAAYTLISGLADVGIDNIADALGQADWSWLLLALVAVQLTNATDAVVTVALTPKQVPVGITTVEQFAISFVNLAVPTSAGRLAVNARFFQRFGISPVTSTSTSMIVSLVGLASQLLLVGLAVVVGHQSVDLSGLQGSGEVVRLIGLAVVVIVAAVAVVAAVPTLRHAAVAKLRQPVQQLRSALAVVRDPHNLLRSLSAAIGTQLLYALGLLLCVEALGGSINLGQALFLNITVTIFAGATPVPGGVGVAEAGLTAGLSSIGIPSDTAVPAVLTYRMVSYYLPPIWGWACMQWLTRHDYL